MSIDSQIHNLRGSRGEENVERNNRPGFEAGEKIQPKAPPRYPRGKRIKKGK